MSGDCARFKDLVGATMTSQLTTLRPGDSMEQLHAILDRGLRAVIADGPRFYGLITRFDLLNHLRRALSRPRLATPGSTSPPA